MIYPTIKVKVIPIQKVKNFIVIKLTNQKQ